MRPELPTGTVTFLFTDIEGSTRLLQEQGDRYARAQDEHNRILRRAVAGSEVCARLDGLPLAIEVAASRISVLTPQAMLERLDRSLPLLPEGPRDLPERHRTLRNAIAWSYDLLEEPLRPLFRDLSCFSGGWTLEAAEGVRAGGPGVDILDGLDTLVGDSLILGRTVSGGRFDMLTTIQEFAREQLASDGGEPGLRRRHAAWFVALAEQGEPHLRELEQGGWLDWLEAEHDNVRAILRWAVDEGEAEVGLRLVGALWRFWQLRGHLTEGRRWANEVLAMPSAAGRTAVRAKALGAAGSLAYWQYDPPAVMDAYTESLQIWEEVGDARGIAMGTYNMAFGIALQGGSPELEGLLSRSRSLSEEIGDRRGVGDVLWALSLFHRLAGDPETAAREAEESLQLHRELGDRFGQLAALHMIGRAAFQKGDLDRARSCFLETLGEYATLGNRTGVAIALDNLAAQANLRGDPLHALRLGGASEVTKESAGGEAPPVLIDLPDPRELANLVLTEEQVRATVEEGRAMTLEQILAVAREEPGS
jgi:hypothetical protein